jgi:hypothetical protein
MLSSFIKPRLLVVSILFMMQSYGFASESGTTAFSQKPGKGDGKTVVACFVPDNNRMSQQEFEALFPLWHNYLMQEWADKKISHVYFLQDIRSGVVFTANGKPPAEAAKNAQRISAAIGQIAKDHGFDHKGVCTTYQLAGKWLP